MDTTTELMALRQQTDSLRAERDQLREKNAVLSAHVERLINLIDQAAEGRIYPADIAPMGIKNIPATTLVQRDARMKADALEDVGNRAPPHVKPWLLEFAKQYRRQAEEGE